MPARLAKIAPWLILGFVAFALSVVFFRYFYVHLVHGDVTAHFIIASAVRETGQLFPVDFDYGNDLIFLRNQYAIALAQWLGFTGYASYTYGSSLMLALCAVLIAVTAHHTLDLGRFKSSAFALLVLTPLGYQEYEFVLGEQSHLLQSTLTLLAAMGLFAFFRHRKSCH